MFSVRFYNQNNPYERRRVRVEHARFFIKLIGLHTRASILDVCSAVIQLATDQGQLPRVTTLLPDLRTSAAQHVWTENIRRREICATIMV